MSGLEPEGLGAGGASKPEFNAWQPLTLVPWMLMNTILIATAWTLVFRSTPAAAVWIVFALVAASSLVLAGATKWLRLRSQPQQILLIVLLLIQMSLGVRWLVFWERSIPLFRALRITITSLLQGGQRIMLLLALAGILILWRRAIIAWDEWIGPLRVERTVRNGVLVFFIMGLSAISLDVRVPLTEFFSFLFAGLLAMGAARMSAQAHQRGGRGVPVTKAWILSMAGAAVTVLAFASGFANVVGGLVAVGLASILGVVFGALLSLLAVLLEPVIYLLIEFWNLLVARLELASVELTPFSPDAGTEISEQLKMLAKQAQPISWAGDLKRMLLLIAVLLVLGIILVVIFITIRRRRGLRSMEAVLERDGSPSAGMRAGLRRLFPSKGKLQKAWQGLNPARRWIAATRIRWIYTQLLRALARADMKRLPAETPLEYLLRVKPELPGAADDLEIITRAYLRVRYGEYAELEADVELVERSWFHIRRLLTARDHRGLFNSIS
ncbi:MAG: DUF4129 domain-containing protein [Anaerolineales bacterium]|jgi:hypothetical protein